MSLTKRKCSKCEYEDPNPLKNVMKCPICGGDWIGVMVAQGEWKPEYAKGNVSYNSNKIKINSSKPINFQKGIIEAIEYELKKQKHIGV